MEYLMLVMIVSVAICAILSAIRPMPILWVGVLLLDIMFAIAFYSGVGHIR